MKHNRVRQLTISALLIAMGILIPMVMPKIVIGPASFTLASHVPLMIAMFFSPGMAVAVALGTAFGFFVNHTNHYCCTGAIASCFCCFGRMVFKEKS